VALAVLRASNATVEGAGEQEEPAAAAAGSNQNRKKGVYSDSTKTKQASSETVRKWTTTRHWLVLCNCDDDTVDKRDIGARSMKCTICAAQEEVTNDFATQGCCNMMLSKLSTHEKTSAHKSGLEAYARSQCPEAAKSRPATTSTELMKWRAKMSRMSKKVRRAYMEIAYNNAKGVTRAFEHFEQDVDTFNRALDWPVGCGVPGCPPLRARLRPSASPCDAMRCGAVRACVGRACVRGACLRAWGVRGACVRACVRACVYAPVFARMCVCVCVCRRPGQWG
jgi:hypothetical protein